MDAKICRLCCVNDGISDIFDDDKELSLLCKIRHCCFKLNICEGDGLPTRICGVCEVELAASYNFLVKCEKSDQRLRQKAAEFTNQPIEENILDGKLKVEVKEEDSDYEQQYEESYGQTDDYADTHNISDSIINIKKPKRAYKKRERFKVEPGPAKCKVCGRVCASRSALVIHNRSHTGEKPYHCSACDKKYADGGGLKRHIERNHSGKLRERKYICETCGKGFFTKSDVSVHMRTHTGETPFSCSKCPSKFTQKSALIRHLTTHTGEKSHACPTCGKLFGTKEKMKRHLVIHTAEKAISCPLCDSLFKYKNTLQKHMRLHTEPNMFVCNYCGRTFNLKGNLKLHIKSQHSEKSGFCSVCSKNVSNIDTHMWRHTGERPLKCELCTSSFYELKALAHHMNFRHKNADKFKCSVEGCTMSFPSRPMLTFHIAKLHDTVIPFPCDRCSRGFYRKNDLARHKIGTHKERLN